jgi:protein-tyrosine-phosphatase
MSPSRARNMPRTMEQPPTTASPDAATTPTVGTAPVVTGGILTLCTGNAARSVMAGAMLESSGLDHVVTAGTHVIEHQPISIRTRAALATVGLSAAAHRAHQLTEADVEQAALIVAMAPEHVRYVRRRHPRGAAKTATIIWLAEHLPAGPGPLAERVAGLGLEHVDPEDQADVVDPAGGEEPEYVACARQLAALTASLLPRLR